VVKADPCPEAAKAFLLEIPWLPDEFHAENRVCGLGPPGLATAPYRGRAVEPPRSGKIRGAMGSFAIDFPLAALRHGA
jgi:hypothetical protein